MIDVKKFVTGFLVLAVSASAAALIISSVSGSGAIGNAGATANNTAIVAATGGQTGAALSGDAFLPQTVADNVDQTLNAEGDAYPALASSTDPDNLTNTLASAYLTNLISANPTGATMDTGGNTSLTPPDTASVIAQLENNTNPTNIQIPDWNSEAAEIPIVITQAPSPDVITNYASAIQDIFNQNFVQTNLQAMLDNNDDPSAGAYIQPKIQTALKDIAGLQTPASLVDFQKSLITLLVYEKNTLALGEGIASSSDPLKTALILQAEANKYNVVTQNFQNSLQRASAVTGFSLFAAQSNNAQMPQGPSGPVAFLNNILGIHTAHAIFGMGDITFDPTNFAHLLLKYAENIALQIAKNIIMYTMQKTVLTWVRGNGVPQFIQNWGTTLVNAYTNAAINALNSQFACVNPAYKAQLQILLKIPTPNSAGGVCAVQFASALSGNNLTNFYKNFSNGGFVSYMAVFQPSGNLFGSAIDAQDAALNAGLQSYVTAQVKTTANQGWVGREVCVNSATDPNTGCKPGDLLNGSGQCIDTANKTYAPRGGGGQCSDGSSPQVLQPGQITGQVFNSAVDSSGKLTAAANSIAGLLNAFTTSLLNSLATDAITATTGALQNLGTGGGSGSGSSGSGQSGSVPISCTPTFQDPANLFSVTFMGAGGQTISVSGNQVQTSNPSYSWSVLDASGNVAATGVGTQFTTTLNASGTYTAVITDTSPTGSGASSQCSIDVPAP